MSSLFYEISKAHAEVLQNPIVCWPRLQVVTPAGMEPDDRDWRAKQPVSAAASADAGAAAPAAAAAGGGGEGRWLQETGGQAGGKAREPPRMAPPNTAAAPSANGQQASAPAQPSQAPQVRPCHVVSAHYLIPPKMEPTNVAAPSADGQQASPGAAKPMGVTHAFLRDLRYSQQSRAPQALRCRALTRHELLTSDLAPSNAAAPCCAMQSAAAGKSWLMQKSWVQCQERDAHLQVSDDRSGGAGICCTYLLLLLLLKQFIG